MNKLINFFCATVLCIFLMSSCASLTGFEEGKTVGEENSEVIISGNFTRVPDLFDEDAADTLGISENIGFPNLEFSYKRGITEKFDIGGRVSTNLNMSAYGKYQLVGDRSSKFALAAGFEAGTILGLAYNVGVPIYASYYPTESVAINLSPRFMYQFTTGDEGDGLPYLGGNFGLLFGKKNKFGLDIGYYNLGNDANQSLLTFGLGGKFKFGDNLGGSAKADREGSSRRSSDSRRKRR